MHVFHVDDSIIGLWGKDPAIVRDNPRGAMYSEEYAGLLRQLYSDSPTRVLLLDTATGSTTAEFGIPSAMKPSALVEDSSLCDAWMVLALEWNNYDVISGFGLYDTSDGHAVASGDMTEELRRVVVTALEPCSAGLVAFGENGSVSLLTLEGKPLWTKAPSGSSLSIMSVPHLLCSNAEGLLAVYYSPGLGGSKLSVAAFDSSGVCFFEHGNYGTIRRAKCAPRAISIGWGPNADDKGLWAFDVGADSLVVSNLRIPSGVRDWALSPSGEYVLIATQKTENDGEVAVYRLGKIGK